jgi:hypothetical protein
MPTRREVEIVRTAVILAQRRLARSVVDHNCQCGCDCCQAWNSLEDARAALTSALRPQKTTRGLRVFPALDTRANNGHSRNRSGNTQ